MSVIILHHYPPSPVSEKVRVGLGIKKLAWRSVEASRLPPRPELFALTGGYRRVPVMQIGADIYCDSQCILRELERRYPKPSFFPHIAGLPFALSRWTDGPLFDIAVRLAFAPAVDDLPPELLADRARLYLGPDGDFRNELEDLPHQAAQLRAQLGWLDDRLASGSNFLTGDLPALTDLSAFHIVWFIRGRWPVGPEFLTEFKHLMDWERRMMEIAHGDPSPMTPAEALLIGSQAQPKTPERADPLDAQGLKPGMTVAIVQDTDSGDEPVSGVIRALARDKISIHRVDPTAGLVCLHFPRVGYRVETGQPAGAPVGATE